MPGETDKGYDYTLSLASQEIDTGQDQILSF
jgi:hypothetical protein